MPVWLIPPMAAGAVIFFRKLAARYRVVRYCSEEHQVESVSLFRHHPMVPCDMALWVARNAQDLWKELEEDFPEETRESFALSVIWNPHDGPGWTTRESRTVVINLGTPALLDVVHNDFEARKRMMRGTLVEELHHVVRHRRFGEEHYRFRAEYDDKHLGTVLYYAGNEFEYEALRYCVRITGDRADLLKEVEDCRRREQEMRLKLRNLFPT
ncbi:MAG TPA: hypothetical protein VI794_03270 [Patescibacteria group bacterium]|nr:hypothetical protein [Patescibacteria group bacterium]